MTNLEYANGLRALADFYENNSEMELPWNIISIHVHGRESFLKTAVNMAKGGKVKKWADAETDSYPYYHVTRQFGEISLDLRIPRSEVCRLISPARYECIDSLLESAHEYDEPELTDQSTAEDLAATAKESIEASQ